MEVVQCHDCEADIVFRKGLPEGQIGVCAGCGEKRRRREASREGFVGFSREPLRLEIEGKPVVVSMTKTY